MKKLLISFGCALVTFACLILLLSNTMKRKVSEYSVALVTDFADVNDASFNEACYKGSKKWCEGNDIPFVYYKPLDDSLSERSKMVELAIDRGANVLVLPGYSFGSIIKKLSVKFPSVKFISIDSSRADFGGDDLKENVISVSYKEDIAGYFAGYGAVKEGFRKLGFLGGMKAEAVIKFGYGYLQGINAAATELQEHCDINYVYGGQFYGDNDITKYMDNWFKIDKTQVVFCCGGSIYTSAALAAKDNGGYIIGVDSDQKDVIDADYGEGRCITSAVKNIEKTISEILEKLVKNKEWTSGFHTLGLISKEDPDSNFVKLPMDTWCMQNFTIADYKVLVGEFYDGARQCSDKTDVLPELGSFVTLKYQESIK